MMWADTDASGRIYFAAIFRWVEAVETGLFRALGTDIFTTGQLPRVHVEADYRLPLRFDDQVELEMTVAKLGTSSLGFQWVGRRDDQVAFEGSHTIVFIGEDGVSAPIPSRERGLLDPAA